MINRFSDLLKKLKKVVELPKLSGNTSSISITPKLLIDSNLSKIKLLIIQIKKYKKNNLKSS